MFSTWDQQWLLVVFLGGVVIGWYSGACYVSIWKKAYRKLLEEWKELEASEND